LNYKGLSEQEVKEKISQGLVNKVSGHKTKTISEIFIENIFSLFNIIILGIIIFVLYYYFTSKDIRLLLDSIGMLSIGLINTTIAVYQEIKAKIALDKVNLLLKREVNVVRDGSLIQIDRTDVVEEDIILVRRGDQAVVDGKILESGYLEIDESLLTGESVPIIKKQGDTILSGSFCVSGEGYFVATNVGDSSFANTVTGMAKKYKFTLTPLQKKINLILKILFITALILVVAEVIDHKPAASVELQNNFIRRIATILISLIPQGLVLLSSVTFALGVYRISKLGAIIQKLNAIESFSNVQIVCMDKTGTLTENKLSVNSISILNNLSEEIINKLLGTYSRNSSEKNATIKALDIFGYFSSASKTDEFPFSSEHKLSILELDGFDYKGIYILGGLDILLNGASGNEQEKIKNIYDNRGLKIYRNLLFGKVLNYNSVEESGKNITGINIEPYCIISISDTARDDVMEAINLFRNNGIELKILSGDSPEAIQAVLKDIGWEVEEKDFITGNEFENIPDNIIGQTIKNKTVFARLKPDHKLRIIKSLRKQKFYTAMIGDGVNDLPAIKEADMGIAMEEGSAITKEIADMVLLKNKFSLLPSIFDEGNKIVNSVNSVSKLFLTKNFMVIYLIIFSLMFLLHFPLTPRRVSLLNIFAIGIPAFLFTLKNKNINKCTNFTKDVFSFVVLSSLVIISSGYAGYYLTWYFYSASVKELEMVMITVLIFISVGNFLIIGLDSKSDKKYYTLYGTLLLLLFSFLAFFNIDFAPLNVIKMFYEIDFIPAKFIPLILSITVSSYLILFILDRLRKKLFNIS